MKAGGCKQISPPGCLHRRPSHTECLSARPQCLLELALLRLLVCVRHLLAAPSLVQHGCYLWLEHQQAPQMGFPYHTLLWATAAADWSSLLVAQH